MSDHSGAIAIVGVSLRFPKAATPDQFWQNLVDGRDCATMLDKEELAKLGVAREKLDSAEYVYRAYDLEGMDLFDARFFGLSPREARLADPQLRIALEAAHECIEDSGHVLAGTNTGLYFGVADSKYWLYYNLIRSPLEEQNEVVKRIVTVKDFFPTQISHKLDLCGPSISMSSACSTGLLATHEACNHLLMYDCDFAIAGGCEILKGVGYKYLEGGLSARDGYVRAFDKDASGTVFGSGVGMVMLRRLADAIEDGDRIYAVIRATAVNNDGNQKVGYMAPGVKGQMSVIHEAIERAGISARDVSYVEAHGTGTNVGDPIEIESISKVYRRYTDDNQYCAIGSVKTNVGHLSIAAGVAGLIKTALMLHHRQIPPLLHFREANPAIDFEKSPFYVARELADWTPHEGRRLAGISAFGVGGTNVHAIVEEAPAVERHVETKPWQKLFLFSAKSEKALADVRQRLADRLRRHPDLPLADVAFTLAVGRQKFDHRAFVVADDRDALVAACEAPARGATALPANATRQTVFMFPGQGSQYADMGQQLYRDEPLFAGFVDECCDEAWKTLGLDLRDVLFPTAADGRIHRTEFTQIALFVVSHSLARLWMAWGVRPDALIGHSIGEYAAACIAGVFSLPDALRLVAHRGRLMQSMPAGSMLSVPLSKDALAPSLDDTVSIAGENSPASCVVSGTTDAIEAFAAKLAADGLKATVLHTSHAFHSHMMDPILGDFEAVVRGATLSAPTLPVVSNVSGTWLTADEATDPAYWVAQLRQPVLFSRGLVTLASQDSTFVEMGPGATLCALVGQHEFDTACTTLATLPRAKDGIGASDFTVTALGRGFAAGLPLDWSAVFGKTGGRRVSLPTYPFEHKSYWIDDETMAQPRSTAIDDIAIEHPLLGRKIAISAKVVVFENVIDRATPKFIADHRLIETVIFPGAGYTQMGLEIGRYFIKNKKVRIDEIRFAQTMMLHEGVKKVVQVMATANGEGCTFEILSRNADHPDPADAAAWTLHAKGRVSPHSINAQPVALPALVGTIGSELLPLSRYYDALKFITFGPSFRAIKRLWVGEDEHGQLESVGLIELPAHLFPEVDQYSFHPVLLDAAFQVIDGPKVSATGTLPVGLRNFTVYDAVPNRFYAHAVRRDSADEEYSIGTITMFSDQGVVIARIEHYLQKEIADTTATGDPLADVLYDLAWQPVAPTDRPAGPDEARWLVVGPVDGPADRIADALRTAGRDVVRRPTVDGSEAAIASFEEGRFDAVVHAAGASGASDDDALGQSLALLRLVQAVGAADVATPRLVVVTTGAQSTGASGEASDVAGVAQAAPWGLVTTIAAEHPEFRCVRADLDGSDASIAALVADLVAGGGAEDQLAYRDGVRLVPRLRPYRGDAADGRLQPPSGPFEIRLMRFGTFENFAVREFVPDMLADNEVLVQMHSAALNFKETLYVLGFLNPNKRQALDFDFGMEGSGRIRRVGSKVAHLKAGDDVIVWHNGCLSSDFVVNVDRVVRKPQVLSHAEACCVPTVFMTAYYALHHLAKIKRGDRVLIHAAAGGVGQVSIQIAQAAGAEIYATASRGKWDHLRQQGVQHVFDSRTLDFSQQILALTGGRGVDIVFNSLNGDFIGKSFDVLADGGCFVEIGKKDIWSPEQARFHRADVDYQVFEIGEDQVSGGIGGTGVIHDLMARILDDFDSGKLAPLPMTQFPVADVQQAYRYLSQGRNIGKVVIDFEPGKGADAGSPLVDADKTYLVTGGLGGLGFLTAEWLVGLGAKHLALTGRSDPSDDVARRIRDLNLVGVNVYAVRGDIGEYADTRRIVETIQAGGAPLGGVLHCAGVLDDALLERQDAASFAKVFRPKVDGTLHLHALTRELPLDFFVCFSSVSAILDGGGQGNYAAANAFMDRLMGHRRAVGLPGLSVNWGAWADVGMAAELAGRRAMDRSHFITADEAFVALERLMTAGDVRGVVCKLGARLAAEHRSRLLVDPAERPVAGEAELGELERAFRQHPAASAEENFMRFLKAQVNKVLGADPADAVDADAEFVALGVDSLSMTELKNAVQHGMGKPLKMATFFANPTVARLAKHLAADYAAPSTNDDGVRPAAAAPIVVSSPAASPNIDFVALDDHPSDRMIFCFPGLNGNIFDFADFATEARHKYKVLVGEISSDVDTLETDICKLAADAVARMRTLQTKGPYALLGYSYGGVLALEVAHQLKEAGHEIEMLMMIDSFPHFHHRHDDRFESFMSALITDSILAPMKLDASTYDRLAIQIMETPGSELGTLLAEHLDGDGTGAARLNLRLLGQIIEVGKRRSLASYQPPKNVDGLTINYVRAGNYPRSVSLAKLDGFLDESSMRDEKYAWNRFVGNAFDVRRVPAQHNEILKATHARTIVGFVDQSIGGKRGEKQAAKLAEQQAATLVEQQASIQAEQQVEKRVH